MYFTLVVLYLVVVVDGENKLIMTDRKLLDKSSLEQVKDIQMPQVLDDKWISTTIKNIAYFLRSFKFNDWDRRFYEKRPSEHLIGFFRAFPMPSLQSQHWQIKANCHSDFYKCINYLQSIIEAAPYSRADDVAIAINNNYKALNESEVRDLDHKCREVHNYAEKIGAPLDDPFEKFQWLTTASYYMCWYTMLGVPALSMIGDSCDNFANCLDPNFGIHNHDPRSNDPNAFACAMYSFCPDPCCPVKHIKSIAQCYDDRRNPCFIENDRGTISRECKLDRKYNQNFKDIIKNCWNISCNCRDGFVWKSDSGMCVDINECLTGIHKCDITSENCLNLPGTFRCICKWGFDLKIYRNASVCVKVNLT